MNFIIRDIQGTEHGPIDEETIAKWVDEDRVTPETPVRNSLLKTWKAAGDLNFLQERFQEQEKRRTEAETSTQKSTRTLKDVARSFKRSKESETMFKHKHIPEYANTGRRILAFVYDMVIVFIVGIIIFSGGMYYARELAVKQTNNSKKELAEQDNFAPEEKIKPKVKAKKKIKSKQPVKNEKKGKENLAEKEGEAAEKAAKEEIGITEKYLTEAADKVNTAVKEQEKIYALHEDNLTAVYPPYTYADERGGYGVSSVWIDTVSNEKYVCLGADQSNACWIKVSKLSMIFTWCFVILLGITLLYYGVTLGYFAQTYGMWFWGIFIARKNITEAYYFRTFIWTLFMFTMGILMPFLNYIFHRGLHDMLSGVRIIKVGGATREE
ncbi:MAG: RDD family protein [Lentisphaerae bacterium]|nr:RDD family protein [Lentisphaerota bacterium]MCP4101790.1 RDD family protein [Lentisphaerota bacterium]